MKRQLELAAYFTHCGLRPTDLTLALRLAMTLFNRARNSVTAAVFAQRLISIPGQNDQRVISSVSSVCLSFQSYMSGRPNKSSRGRIVIQRIRSKLNMIVSGRY